MSQIDSTENNELASVDEQGRVTINDAALAETAETLTDEDFEDVAGGGNGACANAYCPNK